MIYLTDYIDGFTYLNEAYNQYDNDPEPSPDSSQDSFENIKKYYLYGKILEIRYKIHESGIDDSDPDVINLYTFLDIIIDFYTKMTYSDVVFLVNNFIDNYQLITGTKISDRIDVLPSEDPKEDPNQQSEEPKQKVSIIKHVSDKPKKVGPTVVKHQKSSIPTTQTSELPNIQQTPQQQVVQ